MDHAGQGKIQRASHALRMELNSRLFNGQLGPEVLPWLNAQHEIMHICADHFDGESVTAKNLSDYRKGAYAKWLSAQQTVEAQRTRASIALELAKASGGNLSEAAAQLLAGQYLDAFSEASEAGMDSAAGLPDPKVAFAVVALRKADQEKKKHDQRDRLLAQKDRELDLREENTAWSIAAKIKKALESQELQAVAAGTGNEEEKMRDIVRITFGDDLLERIEKRRREALEA
jgi:hypothetical protein